MKHCTFQAIIILLLSISTIACEKTTQDAEIRERITLLIDNNMDKLQKDMDELEPKDRIKSIIDLLKFVVPTLKSQELAVTQEDNIELDMSKLSTTSLKELLAASGRDY